MRLLDWLDGGVESPLELRFLRDVERRHGLPRGQRQQSLVERTRVDVHYDEYRLIAELDGQLGHRGRGEVRDAWRDAAHLVRGESTLRFGWWDVVQRPCTVAWLLGEVMAQRGWRGALRRCPACPSDGVDLSRVIPRF